MPQQELAELLKVAPQLLPHTLGLGRDLTLDGHRYT
jgi:hypothetical protein